MEILTMGNYQRSRKPRKYRSYLLESAQTNKSIIHKYGMPPFARPPELPEDIIERVITKMTPQMWNRSLK